jgi:hypothetical protein
MITILEQKKILAMTDGQMEGRTKKMDKKKNDNCNEYSEDRKDVVHKILARERCGRTDI